MNRISTIIVAIILLTTNTAWAGFCGYLRADTQVIVTIGPFVDVGDGFTPQVDITLGGDEAELMKHGGTVVVDISGSTWAAVANCRGYYSLTLTAGNTDTEGMLDVIVQDDSDCLPVRNTFEVVDEIVYDALYTVATTDYLQVDVEQYDGQAVVDTVAGIPDVNVTYWEDDAVAAAADGHPAVNVEEWNDTDVPADVQAGYPTITIKDGTGTGEINTLSGAIVNVDLVDTTTTNTDVTAHAAVLGAAVGASISADIAAIEAQTDDIGVAGVGLTDLGGMSTGMKAEVNAQVLDVFTVDTFAELGQAAPDATTTALKMIQWNYKMSRNKVTTTSAEISIFDDAGTTVDSKSTLSEDGTTFTKGEYVTGP